MNSPLSSSVGPFASATCLLRGLAMLKRPGLRPFVWWPLLINLALYSLGAVALEHYFATILDWLLPHWLDWLRWLLWPLFAVLVAAIAFFSFTVLANLIASPFYGSLAERVQKDIGAAVKAEAQGGLLASLWGDLGSEIRRLGYFGLRALPLLILSLIPGLNAISPFLWLIFGAWSLSFEYLSYPLEAWGLKFDEQKQIAKGYRLESLAFGGAVLLGLSIPVLNILIPPAAVIGATLYVADRKRLSDNSPSK